MAFLKKGIFLPSRGIDHSRPATFLNDENGFPQNMTFDKGDIRSRYGRSLFGSAAISGGQVMGYGKLELASGSKYLLRASKTDLEKYNILTDVWDDIAVTPFTGGNDDYFDFAVVSESDLIVIANGVNNLRKWTGEGNQQALGGSPGIAKTLCYLSPYLLAGNLIEDGEANPWKVKWTNNDAPEDWSGGNAGSQILSNSGDNSGVRRLLRLNEYAAGYKENSLWLGRLDVSDAVNFECVKTGIGLYGKNSVAEGPQGIHYFMGQNDFYAWDGTSPIDIGKSIRDYVFAKSYLDKSKAARFFAVHHAAQKEIWFHVVPTGQTYCSEVWKYNYQYGIWYYDTVTTLTAGIDFTDDNAVDRVILGDSDGYSYEEDTDTWDDNSVAVSCRLDTKDFTDGFERMQRWLQIQFWAKGVGTIYVDYSIDRGTNWTSLSSATLQNTMPTAPITMYFDIIASHIRFRFRNASSEEYFYLRKFYPFYLHRADQGR